MFKKIITMIALTSLYTAPAMADTLDVLMLSIATILLCH